MSPRRSTRPRQTRLLRPRQTRLLRPRWTRRLRPLPTRPTRARPTRLLRPKRPFLTSTNLAITGGIGAGKSEALQAFARHGAAVISSDDIVHRLLRDDEEVHREP